MAERENKDKFLVFHLRHNIGRTEPKGHQFLNRTGLVLTLGHPLAVRLQAINLE